MRVNMTRLNAPTSKALPLIQSNTQQRRVLDVNKQEEPTTTTRKVLNTLNVSVARKRVPLRQLTNGPTRQMAREIIDSAVYLSETSDFIYENKTNIPTSGSKAPNIAKSGKAPNVLQAPLVQTFIERSVTSFNKVTAIAETETLRGSPALQKLNEDSTVIASGSALSNAVNFNSVVQVQFLDSYDTKEGITKQNWSLLTPEILDARSARQQPLVCKMVKVSSALGTPDILNLEPMSSMFVIGTPQRLDPAAPPPQTVARVRQSLVNQTPNVDLDNVNVLYSKNVPAKTISTSRVAPTKPVNESNPRATVQENAAAQLLSNRGPRTLGY